MSWWENLDYKSDEIKKVIDDKYNEWLECYGKKELNQKIIDGELHHEWFNTDYYIIGTYEAKKWLGDHAFDCIGVIQEYENDNFGECNTKLDDPEKVVNMYVYILGEHLMQEDPRFDQTKAEQELEVEN